MIAGRLGMHASTVYRVLVRERMPGLADTDRATGRPVRYERDRPGELVHVDIKKLGKIRGELAHPWAGQTRGPQPGCGDPAAITKRGTAGLLRLRPHSSRRSRPAYSEVLEDEKRATAAGFWYRAVCWFPEHDITVERVVTDNGACYRSSDFAIALTQTGLIHKRTRPYRPQTNGKVERFNRTVLAEWAYARIYASENARRKTLRHWLHIYNHHRPHTALAGRPPANRVTNPSGQYN